MRKLTLSLVLTLAAVAHAVPAAAQEPFFVYAQRSAWLGFSYSAESERVNGERETRIVVTEVVDESPAAEAGLRADDELVSINELRATPQLISSLASSLEPGDEVQLEVLRAGDTRTLTVTAAERPSRYSYGTSWVFRGDSVTALARAMLDSARIRIDSLRLPNFRVEHRGDGGVYIWRNGELDSLRVMPDSFFAHGLFSDSMRSRMDSVFVRLANPGLHVEIIGDSIVMLDSSVVRLAPMIRQFRDAADDLPRLRGFLRVGMRALGGMTLEEVGPMLGEYFGTERGLLVLEIAPESPAAAAGLREGDVILRAAGDEVSTIDDLRDIVAEADDEPVALTVLRQRREIELTLSTDE